MAVQVATHQVFEYIGASNAWVAKAPMRDSRFRFNAAFASEAVYAFGGSSTSVCTSPGTSCILWYRGGDHTAHIASVRFGLV